MEESGLNKYLDEIGRESLLSAEEERALSERIQKGDERALNKLVEANLRFVVSVANQYKGKGLQMEDLVSEGNIGLLKAAGRFDASKGTRFVNYAVVHVRQQIEKALDQQTEPPRKLNQRSTSVDAPLGHRTNMSLLSVLVNQDAPLADERVHSEDVEDAVEFALGALDERESRVVNAYFGVNQEHETMAEIAEDMDLKRERVRQIRDKAVRKLRKAYKSRLQDLRKPKMSMTIKKYITSVIILLLLPLSVAAQEEWKIVRGGCTPDGLPQELTLDLNAPNASRMRRLPAINTKWDPGKTYRQMVILLSFSDTDFTKEDPKTYYNQVFNEPGFNDRNGAGCVADYFRDQSGGLFNLQFDVFGPYKVSSAANPFEDADENTRNYGRDAMMEAVQMMLDENPEIDYSVYDWNGDGNVNQVIFVNAGVTGNITSSLSFGHIWPNTSLFSTITAPDGMKISNYTISAELWPSSSPIYCGIGTICHEFSHSLGLPDAYPTGGNTGYFSIVDEWDLMDGGNFTNYGWCPPNYSPFEKMLLGWMTPIELTEAATIIDMKPVADGGETYIVKHTDNEFYLLENRQWKAWDAGVPGMGLLIWHINFDAGKWAGNSINNDASMFCYDIVHADNRDYNEWNKIIEAVYQNKLWMNNSHLCGSPYPYINGQTLNDELSDSSVPAAQMYTENAQGETLLGKAITCIEMTDDGLIAFDFMGGDPSVVRPPIKGDVNGDRRVNAKDVVVITNVIGGKPLPADYNENAVDVNEDGIIDIEDIIMLIMKIRY